MGGSLYQPSLECTTISAENWSCQSYTLTRDQSRRQKSVGENRGSDLAVGRSDDRANRSPDRPPVEFGAQLSRGDLIYLLGFIVSTRAPSHFPFGLYILFELGFALVFDHYSSPFPLHYISPHPSPCYSSLFYRARVREIEFLHQGDLVFIHTSPLTPLLASPFPFLPLLSFYMLPPLWGFCCERELHTWSDSSHLSLIGVHLILELEEGDC